jgi:ribosome-associated toxin RatA of RatAB toxin-antitoxin module
MQHIDIEARCPGMGAGEAFDRISDFASHAEFTDAVRSVRVDQCGEGVANTHWEVNFMTGVLLWSERDELDRDAGAIRFTKVAGDPDRFDGAWTFTDTDGGARIRFSADFALGLPSFSELFDPLIEAALYENITSIVRGKLGEHTEVLTPRPGS